MIVCSGCGTAIEDELHFCTECGMPNPARRSGETTVSLGTPPTLQAPLSEPGNCQAPPTPRMTVPFSQVSAGGTAPQRVSALQPTATTSNRAPLFIICGVVAGLLLLILGAVASRMLLSDNKSKENSSDRETQASPSRIATTPGQRVESAPQQSQDLSGDWILVNTIEQTSYPAFRNLRVGYHLTVTQTGTEFKAEGEKYLENGVEMASSQRTPIHVKGSVTYDAVSATFVEEGLRRTTTGNFYWRFLGNANELRGTFVSTAAKSSGSSVATRSH